MDGFGSRVRRRREKLEMSQDELAKKLGYASRSSVNKIEIGRQDAPRKKVGDFASALHTTIEYLMGLDDDPVDYEEWGNEEGILVPDAWDGDPEDYYRAKYHADLETLNEMTNLHSSTLTDEELRLIDAYRAASDELRTAVCAVLGIKR